MLSSGKAEKGLCDEVMKKKKMQEKNAPRQDGADRRGSILLALSLGLLGGNLGSQSGSN